MIASQSQLDIDGDMDSESFSERGYNTGLLDLAMTRIWLNLHLRDRCSSTPATKTLLSLFGTEKQPQDYGS